MIHVGLDLYYRETKVLNSSLMGRSSGPALLFARERLIGG